MAKRTAKKITLEQFKDLFNKAVNEEATDDESYLSFCEFVFLGKLAKDLGKVQFDFENYSYQAEHKKYKEDPNSLMGFQQLENGLCFCGCYAGGDWEWPVYFIVYHDGNEFRGYIPKNGNPWNTDTKTAYGNFIDEEKDAKNFIKQFPNIIDDITTKLYGKKYNELTKKEKSQIFDIIEEEFDGLWPDYNWDLIKKDILERFELRDNARNPRLEERPSWDEYFVALCEVIKARSLDPNTQVGSVIVDENNRIVSTGYNSWPPKCDDEKVPHTRPEKYDWVIHSELNAIASCGRNLKNCIIYIPFMPCPDCFKAIITAGIKCVKFYGTYESGVNKDELVRKMAEMSGVKLERINVEVPIVQWKDPFKKFKNFAEKEIER